MLATTLRERHAPRSLPNKASAPRRPAIMSPSSRSSACSSAAADAGTGAVQAGTCGTGRYAQRNTGLGRAQAVKSDDQEQLALGIGQRPDRGGQRRCAALGIEAVVNVVPSLPFDVVVATGRAVRWRKCVTTALRAMPNSHPRASPRSGS